MLARLENAVVENSTVLEKISFLSNSKQGQCIQTMIQLCSFHMLVRFCSKYFRLIFSSMQTEIPEVQAGFRKGRVTRDQIVKIQWIMEKAR